MAMDAATTTLVGNLQSLIAAAQTDVAAPGATGATIAAAQEVITQAQAVIATLTVLASGTPAYAYTVQAGPYGTETIFSIAQRELGDLTRYIDILRLNGQSFIALTVGQVLLIPTSE